MQIQKVEGKFESFEERSNSTRKEFERVVQLVCVVVESLFISNMLDLQEEIDKQKTELFAVNDETGETAYELDEDCMACSLDKYRPTIK